MLTTIWAQNQDSAVEYASGPPLNMSAFYHVTYKHLQIIHMHKRCIDDDDNVF